MQDDVFDCHMLSAYEHKAAGMSDPAQENLLPCHTCRSSGCMNSSHVAVTISAGVAERSEDFPKPDAVVINADKMLYRAKKAGRNRVVF